MKKLLIILVVVMFLFSACCKCPTLAISTQEPTATSTKTQLPTATSTNTLVPTPTVTETLTPTPTPAFEKIFGLDFGPFTGIGQDPNKGTVISPEQLKEQIDLLSPYTIWVRTYGCVGLEAVVPLAHDKGMNVALGAWLGSDAAANDKEIECLINAANSENRPELLIVGSETLYRGDLSSEQLVGYINQVRAATPMGPIATADTLDGYLFNKDVIDVSDIILLNYYPYWDGTNVDNSMAWMDRNYSTMVYNSKDKPVWISETGWPTSGNIIGEAVASPENAAKYFINFVSWTKARDVNYFYFEAFDEPWKETATNPQEGYWGIWQSDFVMKSGMQAVFDGFTVPDNWTPTETPTATPTAVYTPKPTEFVPSGPPSIEIRSVSGGTVSGKVTGVDPSKYKVAIFIKVDGGWWTKPTFANPLTRISANGYWENAFMTGGHDQDATEIVAFLVPNGTNVPQASGGGLPEMSGYPSDLFTR